MELKVITTKDSQYTVDHKSYDIVISMTTFGYKYMYQNTNNTEGCDKYLDWLDKIYKQITVELPDIKVKKEYGTYNNSKVIVSMKIKGEGFEQTYYDNDYSITDIKEGKSKIIKVLSVENKIKDIVKQITNKEI